MKKKVLLVILTGLVVWGIFYLNNRKPSSITVVLKETGFEPQITTIRQGDTVVFRSELGSQFWPASDIHPTHGAYPEFDPQEPIERGQNWSFKFDKKGSFRFHDHLNPFYMGTIKVE